MWHGFPYATSYEVPSLQANCYGHVLVPLQAMPLCYNTQTPLPSPGMLNIYSSHVWQDSAVLDPTNGRDGSQKWPCEQIRHSKQLAQLQDGLQMAPSSPMAHVPTNGHQVTRAVQTSKDPGALTSWCPDTALDRCRQSWKPELRSWGPEWSAIIKSPSELYSSNCLQRDGTDSDLSHSQDSLVCNGGDALNEDENKALVGSDQSKDFHSILEEDKGIRVCVASHGQKENSGSVTPKCDTLAPRTELTDHQFLSPFAVSFVSTRDVMVGTESAQCASASTQTDDPVAADKHINTEVCMADLDYVAVEFFKLKKAQEKRKHCDCTQRAQRAELSLLALQYCMCRQHCWTLYCATAGRDQGDGGNRPKDPPADIYTVLSKLERDYNERRSRILEGAPLHQLRPLSVDCGTITSATYVPAQIIARMQGSLSPQELQSFRTLGDEYGLPVEKSTNDHQREVTQQRSVARRAVALVPQACGAFCDAPTLGESQTEPTTGETWYDAEEDPKLAEAAAASDQAQTKELIHD